MNTHHKLPFTNLDKEGKVRLILAALITFYISYFIFDIVTGHLYLGLGSDYLAFWSTGKVADEVGYGHIYDLSLLREFQAHERIKAGLEDRIGAAVQTVIPVPYLPVFIIPFQLLSKLTVLPGFILWTVLNVVLLAWYLIKYQQRIQPLSNPIKSRYLLLAALTVSLPVFQNFYYGQLKVFTVIFLGEMILCSRQNQLFRSGLWLGGMLLFPHLLILILPYLLITRRWKTLAGFATSSAAIVLTSIALSGYSGLVEMARLILNYIPGVASNNPQNMMNWRMVGVRLNDLLGEPYGWLFTVVGSLATVTYLTLNLQKKSDEGSDLWICQLAQVFAATLLITWHSHIHMAMCLLPFLLFCGINIGIKESTIYSWSLFPPVIYLSGIVIYYLIKAIIFHHIFVDLAFLSGIVMLSVQLPLLHKLNSHSIPNRLVCL